jgi:glutamate dehydrogenase/leucine dehydrogenase
VGSVAARLLGEAGARVMAVSDSGGGILAPDGLDLAAVASWKREHGSVVGLPGTLTITNEDLLALSCDLLVPAALGDQIRRDNAQQVRAGIVLEGANRPVTPEADEILNQRGVVVIPDILANAGGVTASYFEWVQNIENEQWELETVNQKLRNKLFQATDAVVERWRRFPPQSAELRTDLRTAAWVEAIDRVARVTLKRGIWP